MNMPRVLLVLLSGYVIVSVMRSRARADELFRRRQRATGGARSDVSPSPPTVAVPAPPAVQPAEPAEPIELDPQGSAFFPRGRAERPVPTTKPPANPLPDEPDSWSRPTRASARRNFPPQPDVSPWPRGGTLTRPDPKRAQRERDAAARSKPASH